jgi:hypothetical protein
VFGVLPAGAAVCTSCFPVFIHDIEDRIVCVEFIKQYRSFQELEIIEIFNADEEKRYEFSAVTYKVVYVIL